MKKSLLLFIFFYFAFIAYAQTLYTHRTILKIEPIHLVSGQADIALEKHFSRKSAIEFAAGFIFSDYLDRIFMPNFITYPQIQQTEGYVLRTNYRRYKKNIEQTESVSRYFQIDFFVKVIDYKPLRKENYTIHALKDVVGFSLNWGMPKITSQLWVLDMYAGLGIRIKFYHSDKFVEQNGNWVPAPAHQITNILPFIQAGLKIGKIIDNKKASIH